MSFLQAVKMAMNSLLSSKLRSFLTMLGIIIGIFSVIILIGLGDGTKKQVQSQIESLGTNLITVNITGNRNRNISTQEIEQLKTKPGIKDIAPSITGNVTVKAGVKNTTCSVEATIPSYEEIRNIHAQSGRFIVDTDLQYRYHTAIVGVDVIDSLFSSRDVIGEKISVNGVEFIISGVLEQKGMSLAGTSDNRIIIPLTTAQRLLKNKDIRTFYIEATDSTQVEDAMANLQLFLLRKFNNDSKAFKVVNQSDLLLTAAQTSQTMTLMLGGIAGISLIVGGIGIMNIMLVSVSERTREIGIRKAVGAKRKDILIQFLIEAVVLSGIGGIIGVLLGVIGAGVLLRMAQLAMYVSPYVVLLAFAFSATVGVVFGIYPANKASKLRPIDALRFE